MIKYVYAFEYFPDLIVTELTSANEVRRYAWMLSESIK